MLEDYGQHDDMYDRAGKDTRRSSYDRHENDNKAHYDRSYEHISRRGSYDKEYIEKGEIDQQRNKERDIGKYEEVGEGSSGETSGPDSPHKSMEDLDVEPVSYTHLDVYKRQGYKTFCNTLCNREFHWEA